MAATDDNENIAYYDELASEYALFFQDMGRNMIEEGAWLDGVLRKYGVHRVLDASCGTGRQAIPLRERGYDVVAADPSAPMLAGAERGAREHGIEIELIQAAFSDLSSHFQSDFDAVIALGNGLCNQEEPRKIEESLASLRRCVHADGICLVGIKDFASILSNFETFHGHRVAQEATDRTILFELWDICEPHLLCTAYILQGRFDVHDSRPTQWTARARTTREYMLKRDELFEMAQRAGFRSALQLDRSSEATFLLLP